MFTISLSSFRRAVRFPCHSISELMVTRTYFSNWNPFPAHTRARARIHIHEVASPISVNFHFIRNTSNSLQWKSFSIHQQHIARIPFQLTPFARNRVYFEFVLCLPSLSLFLSAAHIKTHFGLAFSFEWVFEWRLLQPPVPATTMAANDRTNER